MFPFSGHRLIDAPDGRILLLYIDLLSESADIFAEPAAEDSRGLRSQVQQYILEHFPEIKIAAVRVVIGSILVASFTVSSLSTTANEEILVISDDVQQDFNDLTILVNKQTALSPDYVPPDLETPQIPFVFEEEGPQKQVRKEAAVALEDLFAKAQQDHVQLLAVSGYRSYARQGQIYASNLRKSESANRWSARAGESEHQTGLAMDVTSPEVDNQLTQAFGSTKAGRWLQANAPAFGFIIRYPAGKEALTGYIYEPWHLRYVGRETALAITRQGIVLEEYRH